MGSLQTTVQLLEKWIGCTVALLALPLRSEGPPNFFVKLGQSRPGSMVLEG